MKWKPVAIQAATGNSWGAKVRYVLRTKASVPCSPYSGQWQTELRTLGVKSGLDTMLSAQEYRLK